MSLISRAPFSASSSATRNCTRACPTNVDDKFRAVSSSLAIFPRAPRALNFVLLLYRVGASGNILVLGTRRRNTDEHADTAVSRYIVFHFEGNIKV